MYAMDFMQLYFLTEDADLSYQSEVKLDFFGILQIP